MIRKLLMSVACIGSLLFLGSVSASADPFAMSSELTNYCCTDWTNKGGGAPNPGGGLFGAGRELIQGATVNRTVQQTLATAPFDIVLPQSIIGLTQTFLLPDHPEPRFKTLFQEINFNNAAGTLSAGGGPGVFTFCPPMTLGTCGSPGSPASPYHGRIRVSQAGTNQFGGAIGFLGYVRGYIYSCTGPSGGADCDTEATLFTNNNYSVPVNILGGATTASGIMALSQASPPLQDTQYTTPNYIDPQYTTPQQAPGFLTYVLSPARSSGHAWTTGMVTASATQFVAPPFQAMTLTGTDSRVTTGPDAGSGSLTLVTTTLYQALTTGIPTVRGSTLTMNLPEPGMALAMGAGVLSLALMGYTRRRR
jgi:hypothetical protein